MIDLLISVLAAFVILRACLRRAPLPTLMCLGLLGFGLHTGILVLPSSITTPVARLSSDVRAWQHKEAAALTCEAAQASAVRSEDPAAFDRASEACASSEGASGH